MRTLFLLLLTCLPCWAQFGVEQPMFQLSSSASQFSPADVSSIRYWWVSSDITTGATASNWVDRIVGTRYTNTPANSPTNSSSGVWFGGATWLNNSDNFHAIADNALSPTSTVYIILTPVTPAGNFAGVISTGGTDAGGYGLFTQTSGKFSEVGQNGNGDTASFVSGTTYDYASIFTTSPSFGMFNYTNGVLSKSSTFGAWQDAYMVGWYKGAGNKYKGYILEMIWFTNSIPSVTLSNLHRYATNKYGFSP